VHAIVDLSLQLLCTAEHHCDAAASRSRNLPVDQHADQILPDLPTNSRTSDVAKARLVIEQ
jgi:hypothetical protein